MPYARRAWTFGVLSLLALLAPARDAQAQLRVMSYNLLNYPGSTAGVRNPAFQDIVAAVDPHIIVAQEVLGTTGLNAFKADVLDVVAPGQWAAASFVSGPDTENAMYYRTDRVVDVGPHVVISTSLRNIDRWTVRPIQHTDASAHLTIYSVHLASSGGESAREAEAAILRNNANALPPGTRFIVAGDYNIESSTEGAYQRLTESQADNDGRNRDPLNPSGATQNWRNNSAFAGIHTQSTRTGTLTPADGGATGGMDDRFDLILTSWSMYFANPAGQGLAYQLNSTIAFGNDGLHFNDSINDPPTNTAVGQALADDLQRASDHLPVVIGVRVPARIGFPLFRVFDDTIVGGTSPYFINIANIAMTDDVSGADVLQYSITPPGAPFTAPSGSDVEPPLGGVDFYNLGFSPTVFGDYVQDMTITCNDPDRPVVTTEFSGRALRHARPSLSAVTDLTSIDVEWDVAPGSDPTDANIMVYNVGFDADVYQAAAELTAADWTVNPGNRFSITAGTPPTTIEGIPHTLTIEFDATGATGGQTFDATLTLSAEDEALAGAISHPDLVIHVSVDVGSPAGDINGDGALNALDVPDFVNVLLGLNTDAAAVTASDINLSGAADGDDVMPFIELLLAD
jgi:endonuclease/exonuclease/phosphatase family metal-dependent hydrolase